ncbi:hypothetical protein [Sphingobacterium kyonggiense]
MKRFFLYTIILLFMSCGKNHMDEFATGNSQMGIVGKWKLVRSESGSGNGDIYVEDRRSENFIITFDSIGNTTNPNFECKGKYNFTWDEEGKNHGPNMTINFDCPVSTAEYYARFEDNNQLYLSNAHCDELCKNIYRRLKD